MRNTEWLDDLHVLSLVRERDRAVDALRKRHEDKEWAREARLAQRAVSHSVLSRQPRRRIDELS
jgi:hypothetical protein